MTTDIDEERACDNKG